MESFPGHEAQRPLSVAELVTLLRRGLEQTFADVTVQGEIRDLRRPASGHLYFTLADAGAQIRCVLFRSRARLLRFEPVDGNSVAVRGQVTVYDPRGDLQLVLESIEPTGMGELLLALERLKARLAAEGLFDAQRKRPIPELPEAVGLVTSASGAALHDVLKTIHARFPGLPVVLSPALVQGPGAAQDLARAIELLVEFAPEVEVIIIGRGGGSFEDLFAFNEEPLVRAVAACPKPVISAVGHEIDWTLCDLVADERAATPTAAATRVAADRAELERRIAELELTAIEALRDRLAGLDQHVRELNGRLVDPRRLVQRTAQRLDDLDGLLNALLRGRLNATDAACRALSGRLNAASPDRRARALGRLVSDQGQRLDRAAMTRLERARGRIDELGARLSASGPPAVLRRGYAVVRGPQGRALRDAAGLEPGDAVDVQLARGGFSGRVRSVRRGPADGRGDEGQ